jgi:hypothetical protein
VEEEKAIAITKRKLKQESTEVLLGVCGMCWSCGVLIVNDNSTCAVITFMNLGT